MALILPLKYMVPGIEYLDLAPAPPMIGCIQIGMDESAGELHVVYM